MMTTENFCYWLKGHIELNNPKELDEKTLQIVKDHLDLVFKKETPVYFGEENYIGANVTFPNKKNYNIKFPRQNNSAHLLIYEKES